MVLKFKWTLAFMYGINWEVKCTCGCELSFFLADEEDGTRPASNPTVYDGCIFVASPTWKMCGSVPVLRSLMRAKGWDIEQEPEI